MRITILLKTNEGGRWVLPHIEEMLCRRHSVTVIIPPGPGRLRDSLDELDVHVVESDFTFRFSPGVETMKGLFGLRHQLLAARPDVLHYHLYASALAARICSMGTGIPRVHMIAGPLYLDSARIRFAERVLMWLDTKIIAGSEDTARRYKALGLPHGRLEVVPYGVDTATFHAPTAGEVQKCRESYSSGADQFLAVMVAYFYGPKKLVHAAEGIKGHTVLLEAWKIFKRRHVDAELIIVGAGFDEAGEAYRRQTMAQYKDPALNIQWVESVRDVRPYYWAADVSVSPSLSENHGAALEAGASGVPRIVSDAGGLPETTDETSGWVVPRNDVGALTRALEEAYSEFRAGTLRAKGKASRKTVVERFDARAGAVAVADIVEAAAAPASRTYSACLVSEARLGRDSSGAIAAIDAASGGKAWERYSSGVGSFALAARTSSVVGSGHASMGAVAVEPLPYYVGLWQLIRKAPALSFALWGLARRSSCMVVRLPGPLGFLSVAVAKLLRIPILAEVVGDPESVIRAHSSRPLRLLAGPVRHIMRFCVSTAEATRYVTTRTLQERYPPKPGTPSVSMSNVQLHDEDFSQVFAAPQSRPWRLTAIGTQETNYKGHDIAISAIALLRARGYDCELTLVGQGALHRALIAQAAVLKVSTSVTFLKGFAEKSELRQILDETDIFLHPSRSEGLPRVVIEAMAWSRPVIASSVGGIPELLADCHMVAANDTASLVDRIVSMIDNPVEATKAAERNYDVAKTYHYSRIRRVFDDWCRIILSVAGRSERNYRDASDSIGP